MVSQVTSLDLVCEWALEQGFCSKKMLAKKLSSRDYVLILTKPIIRCYLNNDFVYVNVIKSPVDFILELGHPEFFHHLEGIVKIILEYFEGLFSFSDFMGEVEGVKVYRKRYFST